MDEFDLDDSGMIAGPPCIDFAQLSDTAMAVMVTALANADDDPRLRLADQSDLRRAMERCRRALWDRKQAAEARTRRPRLAYARP